MHDIFFFLLLAAGAALLARLPVKVLAAGLAAAAFFWLLMPGPFFAWPVHGLLPAMPHFGHMGFAPHALHNLLWIVLAAGAGWLLWKALSGKRGADKTKGG